MIDKIKLLHRKHRLCEIYSSVEDTDSFVVGYILAHNEQCYILLSIDPYGQHDGIQCRWINDIVNIRTDTKYLQSIQNLYEYHNNQFEMPTNYDGDLMYSLINKIATEKRVCEIELCNSGRQDVVGYIEQTSPNNQILCVEELDEYGCYDGKSSIDISTISVISFDSSDTKKLEILHSTRLNLN